MKANFYVTASDKVWGDKLVAACNSHQKAQEIFDKWQNRITRNTLCMMKTL